jgi:hypothetical protein
MAQSRAERLHTNAERQSRFRKRQKEQEENQIYVDHEKEMRKLRSEVIREVEGISELYLYPLLCACKAFSYKERSERELQDLAIRFANSLGTVAWTADGEPDWKTDAPWKEWDDEPGPEANQCQQNG